MANFQRNGFEEGPVSFACDGDCDNVNVTLHIKYARSINDWAGFSRDGFQLTSHAREPIYSRCGCKEFVYISYYKTYYNLPEYVERRKCRVYECSLRSGDISPSVSMPAMFIKDAEENIEQGYTVSLFLQGSNTVFRGGKYS